MCTVHAIAIGPLSMYQHKIEPDPNFHTNILTCDQYVTDFDVWVSEWARSQRLGMDRRKLKQQPIFSMHHKKQTGWNIDVFATKEINTSLYFLGDKYIKQQYLLLFINISTGTLTTCYTSKKNYLKSDKFNLMKCIQVVTLAMLKKNT